MSHPSDGLSTLPNVFQRLMLQWERFAPYNAGQYMTLDRRLDAEHVRTCWRDVVVGLGLQQIGQHPDAAMSFSPLPPGEGTRIARFISFELNRPFLADDSPLRPFVIEDRDATHVGLVYRHVVADSASIRLVMRAWLDRLFDRDHVGGHVRVARAASARGSWIATIRAAGREFASVSRAKRVRRLPADRADPRSAVAWRRLDLPAGTIERALAFARQRGVKLNDVFVAAAALACEAHVPCEGAERRPDLGVGTIVDVRPADRPPQSFFGVSLGFLQTFWRPHDLRSFDATLLATARTSRLARERGHANASLLRLAFAERYGRRLSDRDLADFYRKRCPLAAGISNVNLNRDWPTAHHPSPLRDYTRVSPLGPMLPLVFTPTTLGADANLGVTYRTSVIDERTADATVAAFVERLTSLSPSSA